MTGTGSSRLTRRPIEPSNVLRSMGDPGAGAVVLFLGTVRDNSKAGTVERLEYEAYEPMAEKAMEVAEEEVKREWPDTKAVRTVHRLGSLGVGEVTMAVAVLSPHRTQAFEACMYAVERIKYGAPIWKRERLADGRGVWVDGVPIRTRWRARAKGRPSGLRKRQ